jgi:uncharacterized membrane protein YgdD (TMEM256/DUF423 family)
VTRTSVLAGLACVFGATAVALGAWAAHGLEAAFGPRAATLVETGVRYQLWHALAMLVALALYRIVRREPSPVGTPWFVHAARLFALGVVLFSGSLYVLALGGPRWTGAAAPFGGLAFILGWLVLGWGAVRAFASPQSQG